VRDGALDRAITDNVNAQVAEKTSASGGERREEVRDGEGRGGQEHAYRL